MAGRNTFFIAGYGPLQLSHQGGHQEIVGYGASYGPLQRCHRGDNQEIAGYGAGHGHGPLQCSHQGDHQEIAAPLPSTKILTHETVSKNVFLGSLHVSKISIL